MTPQAVADLLQSVFGCACGALGDGAPFALRSAQGEVIELRYVADLPALCAAVALGRLDEAHREEALVRLLRTNLHLAHAGGPHGALAPQGAQVHLCWTLPLDGGDTARLAERLRRLVAAASPMRAALVADHVLCEP